MAAVRRWAHRHSTRLYGPSSSTTLLSWIGDERIAIGHLPTGATLPTLPGLGVTHVVNCRSHSQTWFSQDLAVERLLFGQARVAHAPMWDFGGAQPAALWSGAAEFAASALADDDGAGVLIHCQEGRHRSVLVGYAVLRLRGHDGAAAAELILAHRREAELLPAYRDSVERWLAARPDSEAEPGRG
jgi:protein-tyrosine phosphatase